MKNLLKIALFGFAVVLMTLVSCKKTATLNDAAVFIPKSSDQVTAFNIQNMLQKADFESVKQMEFYKKMVENAEKENPALAAILKNPSESGIDLSKNVYMVGEKTAIRFYFSLANPSAFEKMIKETPVSKNGVKMVNSPEGSVAWKGDLAILTTQQSAGNRYSEDDPDNSTDVSRLFDLKADQSIVQNPKFIEIMGSKHDFVSYSNFAGLAELMGGIPLVSRKDLESSFATSYADFENGQMVSKSQFEVAKSISEQFGILFKDNVKTDFSKYLTDPNLAFACTFALDTRGVKQILAENQVLEMLKGDSKLGFSGEDLLNALDGDMMLAMSNQNGEMTPALGIKLKDKNTATKFLNMGVESGILKNDGNGAYSFADKNIGKRTGANVNANGKMRVNDDVLLLSPEANPSGGTPNEASKTLTSNIFAMYMNFQKMGGLADNMKDVPLTDFKMSVNGKNAEATLKTNNPNENVLKAFFKFSNQQYLAKNVNISTQ